MFALIYFQELYGCGARRIGVTSLPPLGCVPAAITLFGHGSNGCVTSINEDAKNFNSKLNYTVNSLGKQYPDLKIAVLDIYQPFYDLVANPTSQGIHSSNFCSPSRILILLLNDNKFVVCVYI